MTQAWGWAFAAAGCEGIMVPSAATTGQNLIVGIVFATDIIIIVPSLYLVLEDVKTQLAPRRQQPTRQPQLAEHS